MEINKMPHDRHREHLCYLNNLDYQLTNPEEYKSLVKDSRFLCKICGRSAAKEENLCKPMKL